MSPKNNIKSIRFREAEQIASNMQQEMIKIEQIINRQALFEGDDLVQYLIFYFREKVSGKPIRAYFSWKCFEYLSYYQKGNLSENDEALDLHQLFSTKLPLAFELAMTIQYLHNQILDEKMDARSSNRKKVNKNLIEANLLREVLFTYVKEEIAPLISTSHNKFLKDRFRKLMMNVDLGQRIEKEYSTYEQWKEGESPAVNPEKWLGDDNCRSAMTPYIDHVLQELKIGQAFTNVYFHRIYWTNVYFFRVIADVVSVLVDSARDSENNALQQFSIFYGFLLQILNDCNDFSYSDNKKEMDRLKNENKKTTDYLADLYNHNITLPLIYHLQSDNRGKIEGYLEGGRKVKKLLTIYPKQVMQEILGSGAIHKSVALSLKLSKAATEKLDSLNPATKFLINMSDIAKENKHLRILFDHDKRDYDNDEDV